MKKTILMKYRSVGITTMMATRLRRGRCWICRTYHPPKFHHYVAAAWCKPLARFMNWARRVAAI